MNDTPKREHKTVARVIAYPIRKKGIEKNASYKQHYSEEQAKESQGPLPVHPATGLAGPNSRNRRRTRDFGLGIPS